MLLASVVVSFLTESYLPLEFQNYLEAERERERTTYDFVLLAIDLFFIIALITGSFGTFYFRAWGRSLFLWTNVLSLFLYVVHPVDPVSGLGSMFSYLESLLAGGILFTMYLPPMNRLFAYGNAENRPG